MGESTTSCRIQAATNARLKKVLGKSKLSRDQFLDYVLNEVLDQVESEEVTYEPLPHVLIVRREIGRPAGETLLQRMRSMMRMLETVPTAAAALPLGETAPPKKARG